MSELVYDLTIAPLLRSLRNLDAIVGKTQAHINADEHCQETTFMQGRLYPNMRPFVFQIQVACDTAKGAAARLAGQEVPAWPDDEKSFDDVRNRINKTITYLDGFKPTDFTGTEDRQIELKLGSTQMIFSGREYISGFVLPNFYFHMVTAYDILRHFGVDIGKREYLAGLQPSTGN